MAVSVSRRSVSFSPAKRTFSKSSRHSTRSPRGRFRMRGVAHWLRKAPFRAIAAQALRRSLSNADKPRGRALHGPAVPLHLPGASQRKRGEPAGQHNDQDCRPLSKIRKGAEILLSAPRLTRILTTAHIFYACFVGTKPRYVADTPRGDFNRTSPRGAAKSGVTSESGPMTIEEPEPSAMRIKALRPVLQWQSLVGHFRQRQRA